MFVNILIINICYHDNLRACKGTRRFLFFFTLLAGAPSLGTFTYSINVLPTKRCWFSVTLVWSPNVYTPWTLVWSPYVYSPWHVLSHSMSPSRSFLRMKAENQNFPQIMKIQLENWHLRSRINLWCKHKFTNVVLSLC